MSEEKKGARGIILQSKIWERYERGEGRETFWLEGEGFVALAVKEKTPVGSYLYCPYGPVVESKEGFRRAVNSLLGLAKEQKAIFVRVEPRREGDVFEGGERDEGDDRNDGGDRGEKDVLRAADLEKMGFVKSRDLNPAHTWVLDLTKTRDDLLAGMTKNKTRCWRNYANKGMKIKVTQDPEEISALSSLLEKVGERNHFNPQSEAHLKNQMKMGFATLYVMELEGKAIAAALVHDYDGVRYYMHAAADEEYRRLEPGAILLVQTIVDAQERGAKVFDFWGITTSDDPGHPWYGFTQYKKSFGGREVDYLGTWDLAVRKVRHGVYKVLREVNRRVRKVE